MEKRLINLVKAENNMKEVAKKIISNNSGKGTDIEFFLKEEKEVNNLLYFLGYYNHK